MTETIAAAPETTVLHVGGLHYASEKAVVERVLSHRPGVLSVKANPVAQTATVAFDPHTTSVAELRGWVQKCGFHCAGQSAPGHVCDPLAEPGAHPALAPHAHAPEAQAVPEHAGHAAADRAAHAHGHGHGGQAGMSMESMVRDMRNCFLVALVFTIPIVIWSPVGEAIFGAMPAVAFGLSMEVWQFLLSLPIVSTRRRSSSPAPGRRCAPGRWT
jgi:Cu2+-exporting ATPase